MAAERVGEWIGDAFCLVGQAVGERLEAAADAVAEQRYLARRRAEEASERSPATTNRAWIELKDLPRLRRRPAR
ncbi:hypothetical protein [Aquisphaera giovannonii]|uniref:hypothetical protein n=1 Tax=Aquisphaera giovannonii TaxID=406548 RepID=UPI0011E003D7|nr:hypothetical protein [Aquisphaera giovannonii]